MRRTGREDSATRALLMDAVENVMREKGYAALSARSIGSRAGLNYQLVFYYFEKLENLFIATYKRRTDTLTAKLDTALSSPRPLHSLWEASCDPQEAALSFEYMAMSNHVPSIREATVTHLERTMQTVVRMVGGRTDLMLPKEGGFTPTAVTLIVAMVGESMGYQSAFGPIDAGMGEARALIERLIAVIEPGKSSAG